MPHLQQIGNFVCAPCKQLYKTVGYNRLVDKTRFYKYQRNMQNYTELNSSHKKETTKYSVNLACLGVGFEKTISVAK